MPTAVSVAQGDNGENRWAARTNSGTTVRSFWKKVAAVEDRVCAYLGSVPRVSARDKSIIAARERTKTGPEADDHDLDDDNNGVWCLCSSEFLFFQ